MLLEEGADGTQCLDALRRRLVRQTARLEPLVQLVAKEQIAKLALRVASPRGRHQPEEAAQAAAGVVALKRHAPQRRQARDLGGN